MRSELRPIWLRLQGRAMRLVWAGSNASTPILSLADYASGGGGVLLITAILYSLGQFR